jgi:peptide/nickel transport system ATP-binding protein
MNAPLLELRDLAKHFPLRSGWLRRVSGASKALDGVDLRLDDGECVGIVGESGCGKSTLARTLLRVWAATRGEILVRDEDGTVRDWARLDDAGLRRVRRAASMVFQDPYGSLNPRLTVGESISEPLRIQGVGRVECEARASELISAVGLSPEYLRRYPHAFSGGQRQRIVIARALALRPRLLVCDEPVSALDVSVQAQVLNLLADLRQRYGLAMLFITHDLKVVRHLCDRVAVMYAGRIVEEAPTAELFTAPRHPYTRALIAAAPSPDPTVRSRRELLGGEVPDPTRPAPGCAFAPRCPHADDACRAALPSLISDGRRSVRCMKPLPVDHPAAERE